LRYYSKLSQQAIDFSNLDLDGEIDFGEEVGLNKGDDIYWEDKGMEQPIAGEIDYNIALEESGIVVEAAGHEGGTATGSEAYTILDNPTTRSEFINQLFEVRHINAENNIRLKAVHFYLNIYFYSWRHL